MIIASFRAARFIVLAVVTALVGVVVQKYFAGPAGFLQVPQVDRRLFAVEGVVGVGVSVRT